MSWPARRELAGAASLADWAAGAPPSRATLDALRGRPLLAAAGIGHPQRFFDMLADAGVPAQPLPLPDHASFDPLPWPAGTADVVVTEKDAVKLAGRPLGGTRAWVVTLDFAFDPGFEQALRQALPAPPARLPTTPG